jgi:AcrR family transcriptional regulator
MKENRKSIILEAAIDTLFERGPAASTMREISRKCGVSLGIINYYFINKGTLYKKLIQYISNKILKFVDFKPEVQNSIQKNFENLINRVNKIYLEHKKEIKVYLMLKVHSQNYLTYKPYFKDMETRVRDCLLRVINSKEDIYDIDFLEYKFWSMSLYSFLILERTIDLNYIQF